MPAGHLWRDPPTRCCTPMKTKEMSTHGVQHTRAHRASVFQCQFFVKKNQKISAGHKKICQKNRKFELTFFCQISLKDSQCAKCKQTTSIKGFYPPKNFQRLRHRVATSNHFWPVPFPGVVWRHKPVSPPHRDRTHMLDTYVYVLIYMSIYN